MKNFIYFLCCFFVQFGFSQQLQWWTSITYGSTYPVESSVTAFKKDNQGNYVAVGYFNYGNNPETAGGYIRKLDANGNILWEDTLGTVGGLYFGYHWFDDMVIDEQNNIYLLGQGSCFKYNDTNCIKGEVVIKFNQNGDFIWAWHVGIARGWNMSLFKDQLYIAGKWGDNSYCGSDFLVGGGFLARLDTAGNFYWARNMNVPKEALSVSVSDENNIYVGTGFYVNKFNSAGNIVWSRHLPASLDKLSADSKGNCYLVGVQLGTSFDGHVVTNTFGPNGSFYLAKLDSNGVFQWAAQPNDSLSFLNVCATDSNVFVTGYRGFPGRELYYSIYNAANGSLKQYTRNISTNFYGNYISVYGNEILIAGQNYNQHQKGNVGKIIDNSLSTSLEEVTNNYFFNIYPNPTIGIFQVNYCSANTNKFILNVINSRGQIIYTETIPKFAGEYKKEIDLSTYSKGIYFIEIIGDRRRTVKRIVVE